MHESWLKKHATVRKRKNGIWMVTPNDLATASNVRPYFITTYLYTEVKVLEKRSYYWQLLHSPGKSDTRRLLWTSSSLCLLETRRLSTFDLPKLLLYATLLQGEWSSWNESSAAFFSSSSLLEKEDQKA